MEAFVRTPVYHIFRDKFIRMNASTPHRTINYTHSTDTPTLYPSFAPRRQLHRTTTSVAHSAAPPEHYPWPIQADTHMIRLVLTTPVGVGPSGVLQCPQPPILTLIKVPPLAAAAAVSATAASLGREAHQNAEPNRPRRRPPRGLRTPLRRRLQECRAQAGAPRSPSPHRSERRVLRRRAVARRRAAGTGAGTAAVDRGPRGRRGGCGFGGGSGGSDGAYGGGSRWPGVAAFDVRALRALRERCGDGVREPGDPWAELQRDISRWGPRWSRTRPNKLLT